MTALELLRLLTLASSGICLAALTFLIGRTLAVGRREYLSAPRGYAGRGLVYAFGRGMVEKESVSLHKPTFIGGMLYHGAIFAAFLYLFWTVLFPGTVLLLGVFRVVLAGGAVVGLSLLFKRASKPHLRRLSCPDDFFANLFVDLFLALAFLHTLVPSVEPAWLAIAILLFLYMPLGKIRHCFFFFATRLAFGVHFGRRGALPGTSREA
jgi:hypothetical protein